MMYKTHQLLEENEELGQTKVSGYTFLHTCAIARNLLRPLK